MKDAATGAMEKTTVAINGTMESAISVTKQATDAMGIAFGSSYDQIVAGGESAVSILQDQFSGLSSISQSLGSLGISTTGGLWDETPLPKHGKGGIFTSPQAGIIGDVPEAVIPLSQIGQGRSDALSAAEVQRMLSANNKALTRSFRDALLQSGRR
jgi:hypothetical protein